MTERISAKEYRDTGVITGKPPRPLKYRNKPVTVDGERFASKKEYEHHRELQLREKAGEIRNLRHEPPYQVNINGKLMFTVKPDHVFEERTPSGGWKLRFLDTKSKPTITPMFRLKKKIFEAVFGVELEIWL